MTRIAPTPKKTPPAARAGSPVLFSVSAAVAVTSLVCALAGLGSAVPRRCRWEKPRSRSGLYHAFAFDNPLTLGCASSSPPLLSPLPGSRLRDGHATGGRAAASASRAGHRQPRHLHSFASAD